ncbi:hypothetical protein BU26DRAFT_184524 [Trematosphaeria pertusa]|uniref:Uncharacterized protein n=1 Tax=Trematosphaeria pertusa TaxID=390896 RepID=A0A6A6HTR5_9PLEO|nr:uncharacterized protein BU26DRAFT_184524 [Trematosphaeria pertusa]KAF2240923.1 hypothetical protein BU26DRAFT_184524 [Trematosphaeria pertusa]
MSSSCNIECRVGGPRLFLAEKLPSSVSHDSCKHETARSRPNVSIQVFGASIGLDDSLVCRKAASRLPPTWLAAIVETPLQSSSLVVHHARFLLPRTSFYWWFNICRHTRQASRIAWHPCAGRRPIHLWMYKSRSDVARRNPAGFRFERLMTWPTEGQYGKWHDSVGAI